MVRYIEKVRVSKNTRLPLVVPGVKFGLISKVFKNIFLENVLFEKLFI